MKQIEQAIEAFSSTLEEYYKLRRDEGYVTTHTEQMQGASRAISALRQIKEVDVEEVQKVLLQSWTTSNPKTFGEAMQIAAINLTSNGYKIVKVSDG